MFANLQLRPAKPHRRKRSLPNRAGISKRRVSAVSPVAASKVPSMSFMENLFGDEFPETFGHAKDRKSILDLPAEILAIIAAYISKLDIKRLRLTCMQLAANVDLRINRVYISPNRANLQRLRWIMQQSRYRNQITEIVWDDAQLEEYPTFEAFSQYVQNDEKDIFMLIKRRFEKVIQDFEESGEDGQTLDREDFFTQDGRLTYLGKEILMQCSDPFAKNLLNRDATLMSFEESYSLYQKLYMEEQKLKNQGADADGLNHALSNFPELTTITLTSEVWKPWNLPSRYNTPFQRSLPPGFRKPSVWPWLGWRAHVTNEQIVHRHKVMLDGHSEMESLKGMPSEWRGYQIVISTLVNTDRRGIQELNIDAGNTGAGIYRHVFNSPRLYGQDTVRLFRFNNLRRLSLALNAYYLAQPSIVRNLKWVLGGWDSLEHLDINFNYIPRANRDVFCEDLSQHLVQPVQDIHEDTLARLKTIALRNMHTAQNPLYSTLFYLRSIDHITFDNVHLGTPCPGTGTDADWRMFFTNLRKHQHEQRVNGLNDRRPHFTWIHPLPDEPFGDARSRLIDEEIDAFLYGDGEIPFVEDDSLGPKEVGWIIFDQEPDRRIKLGEPRRVEQLSPTIRSPTFPREAIHSFPAAADWDMD